MTLTACGASDELPESDTSPAVEEEVADDTVETDLEDKQEAEEEAEPSEEEPIEEPAEETNEVVEDTEFQWLYDELNDKSFVFSSGAGAWATTFTFTDDAQFTGRFYDADGAEMIVSDFTGQFTILEEVDEFTYQLNLDNLNVTSETGKVEEDDGMTITYVDSVHGFPEGSRTFELYLPFKSKSELSDDYLSWVYGQATNEYDFINSFGLFNISHGFGMEEMVD